MSLSAHALFKRTRLGHILTAFLFIVYAGSILVLVSLLSSWISGSPFVIMGFTLVLAIFLNPVRRGFQKMINRRYGD
jgi:uncharacterized membrane protein YczE